MAEYYGVTRTLEYLMHYGVKGMRWGVQKAKDSGNTRRLDRHWKKAQKKLDKLNKKANPEYQKSQELRYNNIAKGHRTAGRFGLGMAAAGSGINLGIQHVLKPKNQQKLYSLYNKRSDHESFMNLQKDPEKFLMIN